MAEKDMTCNYLKEISEMSSTCVLTGEDCVGDNKCPLIAYASLKTHDALLNCPDCGAELSIAIVASKHKG